MRCRLPEAKSPCRECMLASIVVFSLSCILLSKKCSTKVAGEGKSEVVVAGVVMIAVVSAVSV